jgi:DNA (cytosine-5)-methyltransferase 1
VKSTPSDRTTVLNSQVAPTCIDLFAGAGGLSLGLHRTGWNVLAAIDADPKAVAVYRANIPDTRHVLCEDLTIYPPASLAALIGTDRVDLIAGGPPCQGFSQVRQRDGANSGSRLVADPRRSLYVRFFEYVSYFRPKTFVMENVVGIRSAAGGHYFQKVQASAREFGYRVSAVLAEAWKFGVPQKRRRQLIVGIREDVPGYFTNDLLTSTVSVKEVMLGHVIGDLPVLEAGEGNDPVEYDLKRRERALKNESAATYLNRVLEVQKTEWLTAHVARPHNDRDLKDFQKLREGEHAKQATDRGEELEFPYDRGSFHDRYTRQHRRRLCSTNEFFARLILKL